jgi:hypothetical protein
MGQAKQRSAEIEQLKAAGPKVKANIKGYLPDAGLNSPAFTHSHYWFQVGEFAQSQAQRPPEAGYRGYVVNGQRFVELNFSVDIMDQAGNEHTAPQTQDGYMATVAFTPDDLRQMGDEIAKGAMSVRITGTPNGNVQTSPVGDKFMVVEYLKSWSAGNDAGYFTYAWFSPKGMGRTDSNKMRDWLYQLADMVQEAAE